VDAVLAFPDFLIRNRGIQPALPAQPVGHLRNIVALVALPAFVRSSYLQLRPPLIVSPLARQARTATAWLKLMFTKILSCVKILSSNGHCRNSDGTKKMNTPPAKRIITWKKPITTLQNRL
jgi:hypothetical protein